MKVTIIVPIYKGNQYIDNIVGMLKKNMEILKQKMKTEMSLLMLFKNGLRKIQ